MAFTIDMLSIVIVSYRIVSQREVQEDLGSQRQIVLYSAYWLLEGLVKLARETREQML